MAEPLSKAVDEKLRHAAKDMTAELALEMKLFGSHTAWRGDNDDGIDFDDWCWKFAESTESYIRTLLKIIYAQAKSAEQEGGGDGQSTVAS